MGKTIYWECHPIIGCLLSRYGWPNLSFSELQWLLNRHLQGIFKKWGTPDVDLRGGAIQLSSTAIFFSRYYCPQARGQDVLAPQMGQFQSLNLLLNVSHPDATFEDSAQESCSHCNPSLLAGLGVVRASKANNDSSFNCSPVI